MLRYYGIVKHTVELFGQVESDCDMPQLLNIYSHPRLSRKGGLLLSIVGAQEKIQPSMGRLTLAEFDWWEDPLSLATTETHQYHIFQLMHDFQPFFRSSAFLYSISGLPRCEGSVASSC